MPDDDDKGRLKRTADAVLEYADKLANREDRPYMKTMSALCFIAALWFATENSMGLAITFGILSAVWGAFLIPLRWVQHRYPDGQDATESSTPPS